MQDAGEENDEEDDEVEGEDGIMVLEELEPEGGTDEWAVAGESDDEPTPAPAPELDSDGGQMSTHSSTEAVQAVGISTPTEPPPAAASPPSESCSHIHGAMTTTTFKPLSYTHCVTAIMGLKPPSCIHSVITITHPESPCLFHYDSDITGLGRVKYAQTKITSQDH